MKKCRGCGAEKEHWALPCEACQKELDRIYRETGKLPERPRVSLERYFREPEDWGFDPIRGDSL